MFEGFERCLFHHPLIMIMIMIFPSFFLLLLLIMMMGPVFLFPSLFLSGRISMSASENQCCTHHDDARHSLTQKYSKITTSSTCRTCRNREKEDDGRKEVDVGTNSLLALKAHPVSILFFSSNYRRRRKERNDSYMCRFIIIIEMK